MKTGVKFYGPNMKLKDAIKLTIVALLIGIGLLLYYFYLSTTYDAKSKTFIETNAIVIGHASKMSNNPPTYNIIVEYNVGGRSYRLKSDHHTSTPIDKGEIVPIKYNPNDPSDAIFIASEGKPDRSIFLCGALFSLVGLYLLGYSILKSKEQKKIVEAGF